MALPESWSIKSRAHQCSITEKKFADGEEFYTAIYPDPESSGYLRKDFSIDTWKDKPEPWQKPFSFWKSTYEVAVAVEKQEVTNESPEELLSRLIEEDESHTENVRYILAIMLERKKQLKETDTQHTPNGILRIYEHKKLGEIYIVRDPNIPLDQIESVQKEVSDLLDNEESKNDPQPETEVESEPANTEENSTE